MTATLGFMDGILEDVADGLPVGVMLGDVDGRVLIVGDGDGMTVGA